MSKNPKLVLAAAMLACPLLLPSRAAAPGTKQADAEHLSQRGRAIFVSGASPSGHPIEARLPGSGVDLPPSAAACANCHGPDGHGRPEGGVSPSDITWDALTKPYGIALAGGRRRPPYSEEFLRRAITMGIDSGGNRLDQVMPRFSMSIEDMDALIAYLKRVGASSEFGINDRSIAVATTVLNDGPFREASLAGKSALAAFFDQINRRAGIFDRRIELRTIDSPGAGDERIGALGSVFDKGQPFALISPFFAGIDGRACALASDHQMPVIGPVGIARESPFNPYVFYLYASLADQARALAEYALRPGALEHAKIAIIHSGSVDELEAVDAVRKVYSKSGASDVLEIGPDIGAAPEELAARLVQERPDAVFLFAAMGDASKLILSTAASGWRPAFFMPGELAPRDIWQLPDWAARRVFLAFPSLPSDQTKAAIDEYNKLAAEYHLPKDHIASQLSAVAAARVLVEALERAGRDLDRTKLISALESFYEFSTGLTPPITYNANRRIGSSRAYIVPLGAALAGSH